jgi:hypothetical protein
MKLTALQDHGPLGILVFWSVLVLAGVSLAAGILSIHWVTLAASSVWLSAVGSSILVATIFLMLLSFGATVALALDTFEISCLFDHCPRQAFAAASIAGQLLCCVLMYLSTDTEVIRAFDRVLDYGQRNPEDPAVTAFRTAHPTRESIHDYVAARTSDRYDSMATLLCLWLPVTVGWLLAVDKLEHPPAPDAAPPPPPELSADGETDEATDRE